MPSVPTPITSPAASAPATPEPSLLGFDPNPRCGVVTSRGPETWARYEADLEAIFDEIFALGDGRPVVLRTYDSYLPWGPLKTWETCDQLRVCAACFGEVADAIHRAAAKRGVPVAGYSAAFSGPEHVQPLPSAWVRGDGVHPSESGAEAPADMMADLGYETVAPANNIGRPSISPDPPAHRA
jgi:hypothetical protein